MSVADLGISVRSDEVKQASGDLERLTASSVKADEAVARLGRSSTSANADFGRVSAGVDQANAALTRLVALGEQSNAALSRIASGSAVARDGLRQVAREADNTIIRVRAVNDNMAQFRRQNLTYQLFDVGQMAALGQNPAMTLMQQGPQIAQLYAGQGGVNAALRDAGSLATGLVTKLWPVGIAAAAGGLAIRGMQDDIEKLTGKTVTFGDTASQVFGAIKDDTLAQLKPVIEDVGPMFNTAWDVTSGGAVTAAEVIINSFHAAYIDVEYLWSQFPNMMGSLVTTGLNAMIGGIQTMIQTGASYIDAFLAKINAALDKADALLPGKGYRLGTIGTIDFGPPLPDQYSEELSRATEERNRRVNEIMTSSPLRDYYKSVRDRAAGNLEFNLPDGGTGGKIPIPGFRGVDDIPGDQEYLQDFQKKNEARIRQLEDQKNALGLTGAALEAFRIQQEAVNAALSANIELTPEQTKLVKDQATAYGEAAAALAKAKLATDLSFERDQLGRNEIDQQIASRLRSAGLGVDFGSPEAQAMRTNAQFSQYKEGFKGFLTSFEGALHENGGKIGKSFGQAILSSLSNALGKSLDRIFDQFATAFANWAMGGSGGSVGGAAASGVFGTASGFADMIFGGGTANDNRLKASDFAPMSLSGIGSPGSGGGYGGNLASNIRSLAANIGANPRDLAAVMSFESGFRPDVWGGAGKNYYGLIQAGANERSMYGINPGGSLADQFGGIERFFKDRGFKPGMSGMDLYSTVNAGSPGRFNASDAANGGTWGTVADKWNYQMDAHFAKADALLAQSTNNTAGALDKLASSSVDTAQSLSGGLGQLGNSLSQFPAAPMMSGGGGGGGFLGSILGGIGGGLSSAFSGTKAFSWLSANPGGAIGLYADGTENAPPGWAWVGERGPELRKLRAGDVIRSNPRSQEMAAETRRGGGGGPAFNFSIDARGSTMTRAEFEQIAREQSNAALAKYNENQVRGGFGKTQQKYGSYKG